MLDNPALIGNIEKPVLVFGGCYSNLQATLAMKNIAERSGIPPSRVICTGDVVAYCGSPNETVNLIRKWGCHVVMGNCEESVGFEMSDCGCGFEENSVCATLSVDWYELCLEKVSRENKIWMAGLPRRLQFSMGKFTFSVIHGGASNLSEFIFLSSDSDTKNRNIADLGTDCVIGGHCGLPFGEKLGNRCWLNSGVIGMPANEGRVDTWYMIIEPQNGIIEATWHRLEYDFKLAAYAMENAGLPDAYKNALISGLWPSMSVLPETEVKLQGKPLNPSPVILN